jgi:hypothetical protein
MTTLVVAPGYCEARWKLLVRIRALVSSTVMSSSAKDANFAGAGLLPPPKSSATNGFCRELKQVTSART